MVIIINLFWFLIFGPRIILYRIADGACNPPGGFYEYFDNYTQVLFSSIGPVVAMSILAYLLIKSVRGVVRRRIGPANDMPPITISNKSMIHQMDTQLTMMLLLESLITVITYVPYATQLTYANITQNWYKTPLRLAWENLFTQLIHLFSYIFFATSFYVSLFTNLGFRRKFKELLKMKKNNESQDTTVTVIRTHPNVSYEPNYK